MNKKALLFLASITLISTATCANLQQPADPYRTVASTVVEKQFSTSELETIAKSITVKVHVGEDRGSGFLIGKNDNTYQVVTNAHVAERGDNYFIETLDGIRHQATLINKDGSDEGNDLAILEFTSTNIYQLAQICNNTKLSIGDKVLAAGFPYDAKDIKISLGNISLLPDKSLQGGYQIGFNNETIQGMSGGVLLNAKGEVIGILGKGKGAIFDTAYNYQDGTTPTAEQIETMKDASFSIPIAQVAEVSPQLAALVPKQYTGIVKTVDDIAEQITVRIDNLSDKSNGSGVTVAKQGNTYYVATVKHNFDGVGTDYQIVTPDGETHQLDLATVEKSDTYDWAIFSFQSDKDYQIANIGNYTPGANKEQIVFVSGFPKLNNNQPQRMISGGKVKKEDEKDFHTKEQYSLQQNGQGLLYTNISYGGMSGGAVLDSDGNLIGIHTGTEADILIDDKGHYDNLNLGFSLGVPIQDVLNWIESNNTQLDSQWLTLASHVTTEVNETDWQNIESQLLTTTQPNNEEIAELMNYGNQLWRYEKFDEAVNAFEEVISLNPNYDKAYYAMGLAYRSQGSMQSRQGEFQKSNQSYQQAVTALEEATKINPNPYYYWRWLGYAYTELEKHDRAITAYDRAIEHNSQDFVLHKELGDALSRATKYQEAVVAYTEAAKIKPKHPWIYNNRGNAYNDLKEYDKAIADFDLAIEYNSLYDQPYNNRANTYHDLKQYDKAIADYTKAIEINPENDKTYFNLGILYKDLKQYEKAIAHWTQGIAINERFAQAYYNRGTVYHDLQQYNKAIPDLTQAIAINPNFSDAYHNRGTVYKNLKQYDKAIADFTQALNIDRSSSADTYFNRGNTYGLLKQYDKAIVDYTQAINIDSNYKLAYSNRGNAYSILKQYDKAIADYTQAINIDSNYADGYFSRAMSYALLENLPPAKKDLEVAANLYQAQNNPQKYQQVVGLLKNIERALELLK
jgi:tetratricopeptide (TPR) repeat protein/S1-C subfamily serine protease